MPGAYGKLTNLTDQHSYDCYAHACLKSLFLRVVLQRILVLLTPESVNKKVKSDYKLKINKIKKMNSKEVEKSVLNKNKELNCSVTEMSRIWFFAAKRQESI